MRNTALAVVLSETSITVLNAHTAHVLNVISALPEQEPLIRRYLSHLKSNGVDVLESVTLPLMSMRPMFQTPGVTMTLPNSGLLSNSLICFSSSSLYHSGSHVHQPTQEPSSMPTPVDWSEDLYFQIILSHDI